MINTYEKLIKYKESNPINKTIKNIKIKSTKNNMSLSNLITMIKNSKAKDKEMLVVNYSVFLYNVAMKLKERNYILNVEVIMSKEKDNSFKRILIYNNMSKSINKAKCILVRNCFKYEDIVKIKHKYVKSIIGDILVTTNKGIQWIDELDTDKIGGKLLMYIY